VSVDSETRQTIKRIVAFEEKKAKENRLSARSTSDIVDMLLKRGIAEYTREHPELPKTAE